MQMQWKQSKRTATPMDAPGVPGVTEGDFSFLGEGPTRTTLEDAWQASRQPHVKQMMLSGITKPEDGGPSRVQVFASALHNAEHHSGGSMFELYAIMLRTLKPWGWKGLLAQCGESKNALSFYMDISSEEMQAANAALRILSAREANQQKWHQLEEWARQFHTLRHGIQGGCTCGNTDCSVSMQQQPIEYA
jgi:hypothetical protein